MNRLLAAAATVLVAASVLSACSDEPEQPAPAASTPAAEPADAPTATAPVGTVVPLPSEPEGIAVTTSGVAAVGVRNPDGIRLLDASTGVERSFVPTTGAPRHLSLAGPDGPVLAPLESSDELAVIDPNTAAVLVTVTGVGRQPHDAAATSDGTIVVTNEMGGGVVFVRDGAVSASLPAGPVQPGGIAAAGDYAAVADVQGNGVWVYSGSEQVLKTQAPVGTKLTHALALADGLVAFADTDGGSVFVERIGPAITEVSRVDTPGNPYGLAYDPQRTLLFVTLTESNIVRVFDMTDPAAPLLVTDIPTVQQANSIAIDPRSGGLLITGSDPGSQSVLQIVPPELIAP